MARRLVSLIKLLCLWLLLHFLVHTFVTYRLEVHLWAFRAWKEIVIGLLGCMLLFLLFQKKYWKKTLSIHPSLWLIICLLVLGIVGTGILHLVFVKTSLTTRAMAMRYDYLWFILLALWWSVTLFLKKETSEKLLHRYARIIKRVLLWALLWWCIVAIKPGTLKLFWFNNYVFEWTVGMQPPAVYYTHINTWLPRSQFWFERPTTFWFWLTAFFPLFFLQFLFRRPRQETRAWWLIYGLNVVLTFSRAAWWSWIVIVVLCVWLTSKLPLRKLILKYWLPLLVFFGLLLVLWWKQIALRWYSNYGHMTMIKRGLAMVSEKPLWWWWWATAWPGSHREGWLAFNPENQFLQIFIEFWVIGALPWLFLRWLTIWLWMYSRREEDQYGMMFALGMVSLTISGLVLHSFGDRMSVYPFMLLFGIALWNALMPLNLTEKIHLAPPRFSSK